MNKVILIGRLTKDPEVKYAKEGALPIANITLAVDRPYQKGKSKEADFIPCVFMGKAAEIVGNHCQKGKQIAVEGRMQVRNYENKEGKKVYVTEVICDKMEFVGDKGAAGNTKQEAPAFQGEGFEDVNIPF